MDLAEGKYTAESGESAPRLGEQTLGQENAGDLHPERNFEEEVGGAVVLHGAAEPEDKGTVELGRDLLLADDVRRLRLPDKCSPWRAQSGRRRQCLGSG